MTTIETLHAFNRLLLKLKRIVVVLILIAAAWMTFDVYCKRGERSAGPELGAAINLTSHASEANPPDLRLSVRPPVGWKLEEHESPGADMVVTLLPLVGRSSSTVMSLVITREPAILSTPKPIIQPDSKVYQKREVSLGGKSAWFIEASLVAPNSRYSRSLSWQASIDGRHVAVAGTVSGAPTDVAGVDAKFEEFRATFEAVATSLQTESSK